MPAKARIGKRQVRQKQKLSVITVVAVVLVFAVTVYLIITSMRDIGGVNSASGAVAPSVSLVSLDGSLVTVPDTNRQATVLFAMAYWCGRCIPEAQALARLEREYGGALRVVVVDVDPSSTPDIIQDFIDITGENNLTWAFDRDGSFSRSYGIRALDTTIIVDRNGREVYRDGYPSSYEVLRSQLEEIISA